MHVIMRNMTLVAIFIVLFAVIRAETITVTTPTGDIIGTKDTVNVDGSLRHIQKFVGIPYAEPPIRDRRFSKPVPKARFAVPFQATRLGPTCYQQGVSVDNMSEDCLLLNIFSPDRPTGKETFSVMVFIHGGGYTKGSSNYYPSDYLSYVGGVIVVTFNYRLAELGFMSFVNSTLPGNMGLWDQHLAIKWVHGNIGAFGGDVSRVTIFGESAGSESVIFHTIYPGNRGLFQRAIAESGSATSSWAFLPSEKVHRSAIQYIKASGCSMANSQESIKCMRSKSFTQLLGIMSDRKNVPGGWTPVVDHDFVVDLPKRIIDGTSTAKSAVEMFKSVDLMYGVNNLDGYVSDTDWMSLINQTNPMDIKVSKRDFEALLIPDMLDRYYGLDTPDVVLQMAIFEYTDWSDPEDDVKRLRRLTDMSTELFIRVPGIGVADNHVQFSKQSTYMYLFSTSAYPFHLLPLASSLEGPAEANHADELAFLFRDEDMSTPSLLAKDRNMTISQLAVFLRISKALITMWTNFAKTGNPNQPVETISITNAYWSEYGVEQNYLEITPEMSSKSLKQRPSPRAVDFFTKIIPAVIDKTQCKPCQTANKHGFLFG